MLDNFISNEHLSTTPDSGISTAFLGEVNDESFSHSILLNSFDHQLSHEDDTFATVQLLSSDRDSLIVPETEDIILYNSGNHEIYRDRISDTEFSSQPQGLESFGIDELTGAEYTPQAAIVPQNNVPIFDDTLATAQDLGILNGVQVVSDFVGDVDVEDYYRFTLDQTSDLYLSLDGLSADADLELIQDINGDGFVDFNEVLNGSYRASSTSEEITQFNLFPGTYFVNVYQFWPGDNTNYNLTLSTTPILDHNFTPPNDFNSIYGYGLVDGSAAVNRAIDAAIPFPEIAPHDSLYWGVDRVNAPEVWNASGSTGEGIVVAVIDSGVDYTHPDLVNNIWRNVDEIPGNNFDDDANGLIDDVMGWNVVHNNGNIMDYRGHGTAIAGVIAAESNGFGITGIAPNAEIMPIRVFDEFGSTQPNQVVDAINYALLNGADVINLSLGSDFPSPEEEEAIRIASENGVTVVMAAGNDGGIYPNYPAYYATNNGIAVGAIDFYGNMADFSFGGGSNQAGYLTLDYVVAPGKDIYSTSVGNSYDFFSGTSFAAPHVAGIAALILSANPNLTPEQVENILVETANPNAVVG